MYLKTNYDWYNLLKVVHDPTVFLNWKFAYHDLVENQARINLKCILNITLDMLTGYRAYPVTQATIGLHVYFIQVADLAGP